MSAATISVDRPLGWTPGFMAEFPDSSAMGSRPFALGTGLFPIGSTDDLMETLGQYSREPSKMANFLVVEDQDTFAGATAPINEHEESSDDVVAVAAPTRSDLDAVQAIVREFERLADGWDEPGSLAPTRDIVDDALVVLQNWQPSGFIPEPEASVDGKIVLEIYDDDGFTLGGVELIGGHRAVYSVNWRTNVLDKGSFDTTSQSEIIGALSGFKVLWERERESEPGG